MTPLTCAPAAAARALAVSAGLTLCRALLLGTALATITAAAPAAAQARDYAIAPGPLGDVLARYAAASGVQLVYQSADLAGRRSAGISGSYTVEQGFAVLLAGSGFELQQAGAGRYVLVRPQAQGSAGAAAPGSVVLDTVTLRGGTATTEGSGRYATEAASIARGADSLNEVPQSVTVLTDQALKDQNLTMMSQALAKAPGIVATTDGTGNPEFRSRGFVIDNYQIDNLGTSYTSTFRPDFDLSIYDRVEVLRGAEGLFSAPGEPGGTINLACKRPTEQLRSSVSLAYGSWNNRRLEADIGGPIAFDGRLRGRVIGVWQDRDYFYKPADQEKQVLYGILEYDLTPSTTISGGLSYQHQTGTTWMAGLPTFVGGGQLGLPRDVALNADWANRNTTIRETFLSAEHRFNDDWTLKFSAMKQKYDFDYMQLRLGGPVDPATGSFGDPNVFSEDDGNHSDGFDLNVSGRFNLWGLDYKLVAGTDWRRSYGKQIRYRYETAFLAGEITLDDLPDLDDLPAPTLGTRRAGWPAWRGKQQGIYARLDMQPSERMHVIVGGRYGNYKHSETYELYDDDGNLISRDTSWKWREDGIFTPYAGVTYDLTPDWTAYGSITEIYKPQGNIFAGPPENPTQLAPITGRNFELGAKGAVLGGALNLSAAVYRIERNGEAVQDLRYGEDSPYCLPLGKIVSQGLELEASGEVAPGWQIYTGYTWNQNRNDRDNVVYSALTPKHVFKLWTDYNLPGDLSKWTVGGGVTVKSKHANTGTYWVWAGDHWDQPAFAIKQGGYAVWDAHVNYQIDDRWNLALNVNNVFDKNYYATLGQPSGGNWYGEPRNATLTLRGQF